MVKVTLTIGLRLSPSELTLYLHKSGSLIITKLS
ncbi:Uncharacterised protein [Vibrio cholerae]|nr:Uncharacterised protein [Vibrio cholerae]